METYKQIRSHLALGNLNTVIQMVSDHQKKLMPIMGDIKESLEPLVGQRYHMLSPASVKALGQIGLSPGFKTKSVSAQKTGAMVFPAVTSNYGCLRWIQVSKRTESSPREPRLQQLDRVGAAVFRVLKSRTKRLWKWNPHGFRFSIIAPDEREDPNISGNSMELALAISLFSLITGLPVPNDISASAEVLRSGQLNPVSSLSLERKIKAIKREAWQVQRFIVSNSQQFPQHLRDEISVNQLSNLEQALEMVFPQKINLAATIAQIDLKQEIGRIRTLYNEYLIDTAIDLATDLICYLKSPQQKEHIPPETRLPALFTCLWRRGSCRCHQGQTRPAFEDLKRAQNLFHRSPGKIPPEDYSGCCINFAVTLKDVFRYQEAEALHHEIKSEMEQSRRPDYEQAKNLSSLSQMYLAQNRLDEAIQYQEQAIKKMNQEEVHRNHCLLAQIYGRNQQFVKAKKQLKKAQNKLSLLGDEKQRGQMFFFHWIQMEILYRQAISSKNQCSRCLQEANKIRCNYPEINHYAHALIYKFCGLLNLASGEIKDGLDLMEDAIRYLETASNPMLYLLSASVRAHRALYYMTVNQIETAQLDIEKICSHLRAQKDINSFFKADVRSLSSFAQIKKNRGNRIEPTITTLNTIIQKIPY